MKRLFAVFTLLLIGTVARAEDQPFRVFCTSPELEAGFEDEDGQEICKQLFKRGKKKKSVVEADEGSAEVHVRFLGVKGESVVEESGRKGVTSTWQPDKVARTVEVLLTAGDYEKVFSVTSTGGAHGLGLGQRVEEWIRKNSEAVRNQLAK